MNTKSLFLSALLLVSASLASAGTVEPGLAVIAVKGSDSFRIIYKGESVGKIRINIYNSNGTQVVGQTINGVDGFILPVNFSGVTFGEYTVEVIDAAGKQVEKIVYQADRSIKSIHVSRIAGAEEKYLLSISNKGTEQITLKIYDKESNLIHSENATIEGDYARVYKLTAPSNYTFEITDHTGTTKTIQF